MSLIKQFKKLETRQERRLFALEHSKDDKTTELMSFEKISDYTINVLFYKSQGEQYNVKRKYSATYQDKKEY
jgi:hypothetical protein